MPHAPCEMPPLNDFAARPQTGRPLEAVGKGGEAHNSEFRLALRGLGRPQKAPDDVSLLRDHAGTFLRPVSQKPDLVDVGQHAASIACGVLQVRSRLCCCPSTESKKGQLVPGIAQRGG